MKKYIICHNDGTITYEGENEPFWDLWLIDENDEGCWCNTVIGDYGPDDAFRLLGVPQGVVTEESDASDPYTSAWTYEFDLDDDEPCEARPGWPWEDGR